MDRIAEQVGAEQVPDKVDDNAAKKTFAQSEQSAMAHKQAQASMAARLIDAIVRASGALLKPISTRELRQAIEFDSQGNLVETGLQTVIKRHRLMAVWAHTAIEDLPSYLMPVVLALKEDEFCVVLEMRGQRLRVAWPGQSEETTMTLSELKDRYDSRALIIQHAPESSAQRLLPPKRDGLRWYWSTIWAYRGYYFEAMTANVIANVLTVAVVFFAMNVYDRVVPTQAYTSLWTLAIGTSIAILLEFTMRWFKASLVDVGGKKADLAINAALLREILSIRLEHRPQSIGIFASSMRDFEALRDFFSSASLVLVGDLPFIVMFIALIWMIAGPLAWVPAAIVPLLIIIGLAAQYPLMRAMRMNMKESGDKQSVLVESLLNLELIKSHRAEDYLQRRWDFSNGAAAQAYKRARSLTNLIMGLTAMLQQLVTVAMIVAGVYLIGQNTLTLGALIAAVILAGRAISPLGNVMALAARYQQALASLHTLEHLMQRPRDRERDRHYVAPDKVDGGLNSVELEFAYPDEHKIPVIKRVSLSLKPGEHMALLGRVGSGKSTLIRLMSGLYTPLGGHVLVDGVDLQQVDPSLLREHIGYVGQDAQLFMGTLRDNLVLADNRITDSQIIDVLKKLDLYAIVANHPKGLDMPLSEAGGGLSGGQRQLLAIARMMLRQPQFVFMDEPTSHMDQHSEKRVIDVLEQWLKGRTLLLATHRLQLLAWVDQVSVLERGQVIAQGPRDEVLKQLSVGIAAPTKRATRTPRKSAAGTAADTAANNAAASDAAASDATTPASTKAAGKATRKTPGSGSATPAAA